MAKCVNCGQEISSSSSYCNNCGVKRKKFRASSIIILAGFGLILGLFLLNNSLEADRRQKQELINASRQEAASIAVSESLEKVRESQRLVQATATTVDPNLPTEKYVPYVIKDIIEYTSLGMSKPNSADGVDFKFQVLNKSDRVIKYINFEVIVKNRVGDIISCDIARNTFVELQMQGPIAPNAVGGEGEYWQAAFYNSTAHTFTINGITIIYEDGGSKKIDTADCRTLLEYYREKQEG